MNKNYRRCISCRRLAHKEDFWRVVRLYHTKEIAIDRGMGRSAYLCPQASCLAEAKQKNRLQRSLRVKVPEQIYNVLENRLP